MDRIDAMTAFVATVDEGSLAGAARRLGRSPAAIIPGDRIIGAPHCGEAALSNHPSRKADGGG
jgi:hypothetical protein